MNAELIIDILKEKIPSVKPSLLIHDKIGSGTEFNVELGGVFFLSFIHQTDLFFSPGFGIRYAVLFAYLFF